MTSLELVNFNIDLVAIIPARAGSKRLPNKNTKLLCGKPLIQWTIDSAIDSGVFDKILVTTNDDGVKEIVSNYQNVMLVERPSHLATDEASSLDVIEHALSNLESLKLFPKRLCLLQPTSPLRTEEDIRSAVKKMDNLSAESIISVCEAEHSPLWISTLPETGDMSGFINRKEEGTQKTAVEKYYRINGAIYLANKKIFLLSKNILTTSTLAYVMPQLRSVDIDTEIDFCLAEILMMRRQVHDLPN